jgi:hypothetical protein
MDRDELHERIMLLKEEIEAGRVRIRKGLRVIDSLQKVRMAPDGKVDPDSVEGDVRALAMGIAYGRFRREAKKIPLMESQIKYFEILDKFYGKPFAEMKKHGLSPPQVAQDLASRPKLVEAFAAESGEFFAGIKEFWEYYGPVVETHVSEIQALKSVFGGDIFPSYVGNIAASVGLYIDTLILPDPLTRTASFLGAMKPQRLLFFTAKHALNALSYKDLALADVNPPIVVIAPDPSIREDAYGSILKYAGEADLVLHSEKLFGRSFADMKELTSFSEKLSNTKDLMEAISEPSRLLFDTEWSGTPEEQIQKYVADAVKEFGATFDERPIGTVVQLSLLGRMMQANDVLFKASRLGGNPLIDAPTSWQYLQWSYEYDGRRSQKDRESMRDFLVSEAIAVGGSNSLSLLSGVPPETLIELRRAGAMSDLRELIRKGIHDVDGASLSSLVEVSDAVGANLSNAFAKHEKELKDLSSERKKFFGFDVGRWIVIGGVSISAASTGNPALAVLAALLGTVGSPSIEELRRRWKDVQSRKEELKRSPTGILFRHLDRN